MRLTISSQLASSPNEAAPSDRLITTSAASRTRLRLNSGPLPLSSGPSAMKVISASNGPSSRRCAPNSKAARLSNKAAVTATSNPGASVLPSPGRLSITASTTQASASTSATPDPQKKRCGSR